MQSDHRKYQVLEPVGKGGFGTVYRAQLLGAGGFQKIVALKVLNTEIDGAMDFAQRLRDEARMLGLLQHRSIVRVDGLQQLNGRWTVVMEYVPGVDLKRLVHEGPVPVAVALELMEEVADALYSAFERSGPQGEPLKLLHRDIKPSNIHLTPAGEVKVLDFGVARADFQQRESVTRSFFFGSLAYMAPERLDGIDTHQGDVYALGSVLSELLTGSSVGRTSGHPDRHAGILEEVMNSIREKVDDPRVEALLRRTMAYEAEDRPSARELTREIRTLRNTHSTPWLREWAEGVVPRLRKTPAAVEDDLSGSILIEQSTGHSDRSPNTHSWSEGSIPQRADGETWIQELVLGSDEEEKIESAEDRLSDPDIGLGEVPTEMPAWELEDSDAASDPTPRVGIAAGLLSGVALVLILVLGGICVWLLMDQSPEQPQYEKNTVRSGKKRRVATQSTEPAATPVPQPAVVEIPTVEIPIEDEPSPIESVEPTEPEASTVPEDPVVVRPPSSSESESPVETVSRSPATETGRVQANVLVELKADGETHYSGEVPAGTYDIWAYFEGPQGSAVRAGTVEVAPGETVSLVCAAGLPCGTR